MAVVKSVEYSNCIVAQAMWGFEVFRQTAVRRRAVGTEHAEQHAVIGAESMSAVERMDFAEPDKLGEQKTVSSVKKKSLEEPEEEDSLCLRNFVERMKKGQQSLAAAESIG